MQYERIDVSEGTDFDKIDKPKECVIWNYCFFKVKNFNFEKLVCNSCHDISMMCYELKNLEYFKI